MKPLYSIRGKVQEGKKRGKLLGFPTANVRIDIQIPEGIYASQVIIENQIYQAATFIGAAETFGEKDYKLESYIINFDKNIYGKFLTVSLFKKLRDNKKFASEKKLIIQMKKDVQDMVAFFNTSNS